jgi:uroporphyrinogen-III decarboxylase
MVTAGMMNSATFADFFRDGGVIAEGQIMTWRRFGHDVLILEKRTVALAEAGGAGVKYKSEYGGYGGAITRCRQESRSGGL